MIKCPQCNKEFETLDDIIPMGVQHNIISYGTNLLVSSKCCSKPLMVKRIQKISIEDVVTNRLQDDWGIPFSIK